MSVELTTSDRFWLWFFVIGAFVFLGITYAVWDSYKRDRDFDSTATIVESCVKHNVRQQVTVK